MPWCIGTTMLKFFYKLSLNNTLICRFVVGPKNLVHLVHLTSHSQLIYYIIKNIQIVFEVEIHWQWE